MPAFLAVTNTQTDQRSRASRRNAERVVDGAAARCAVLLGCGSQGRPRSAAAAARHAAVSQEARLVSREGRSHRAARAVDCAPMCSSSPEQADAAARAARLAKADLATDMVREFTELQGMMGGIYAREAGEPEPSGRRSITTTCRLRWSRRAARRRRARCGGSPGPRCRWPTSSTRSWGCSSLASGRPARAIPSALRRAGARHAAHSARPAES